MDRTYNVISGREYLNSAFDYITDSGNEKVEFVIYYNGGVLVFVTDENGHSYIRNFTGTAGLQYAKKGFDALMGVTQAEIESLLPYQASNSQVMQAGAPGWIKKDLYKYLARFDNRMLGQFINALQNGHVAAKGMEGIKRLKGSGIDGYLYELKLLGENGGYRLLGNTSTYINQAGKEIEVILFETLKKTHH